MGHNLTAARPERTPAARADTPTSPEQHSCPTRCAPAVDQQDYATCLNSDRLRAIRLEFIRQLPSSEQLRNFASSLSHDAPPRSEEQRSAATDNQTQSSSSPSWSGLFSQVSSFVANLGTRLLGAANSIVSDIAQLKESLEQNPGESPERCRQIADISRALTRFEKRLEELRQQLTPDQYQALVSDPRFKKMLDYIKEYRELEKTALQQCGNTHSLIEQANIAPSLSNQSANALTLLQQQVQQQHEVVDSVSTQMLNTLVDGNAQPQAQQAQFQSCCNQLQSCTENTIAAVESFNNTELAIAQQSGNATLIQQVAAQVHYTQQVLYARAQKLQTTLNQLRTTFPEGWQSGLSMEHYIHNPGSMFASAINQLDLEILREQQKRKKNQLSGTTPSLFEGTLEKKENTGAARQPSEELAQIHELEQIKS